MATAAATSVSSAQATHVFGHGTGQMRHKGWSNSGFKFNQGSFTRHSFGRYHGRDLKIGVEEFVVGMRSLRLKHCKHPRVCHSCMRHEGRELYISLIFLDLFLNI